MQKEDIRKVEKRKYQGRKQNKKSRIKQATEK